MMRAIVRAALASAALCASVQATRACDPAAMTPSDQLSRPSPREVQATFGRARHPLLDIDRLHTGWDFAGPIGDPVRAAGPGRIVTASRHGEYGLLVELDHGGGISTAYAHFSRFAPGIEPGRCVEAGVVLGHIGTTGLSAAPHLHFEVRRDGQAIDPAPFMAAR